jgi:ADP-ribose pyrophosphatase
MDEKVVFSVPWFDVVERAIDGSDDPYYIVRTGDYVTVLATTVDGSVLLVRQYRPVVGEETLELPSGNVEYGETPEAAARRELAEETGYEAKNFELLGAVNTDVGRLCNKLWCFYAEGAAPAQSQSNREEGIELVRCERGDFARRLREGEINNALNLAVLFMAQLKGRLASVAPNSLGKEG